MSTLDTKSLLIDHTAYQANRANENGQGLTLLELFLQNQDVWERRKMFLGIALSLIQSGQKEISDPVLIGFFAYLWPDSPSKAMLLDGLVRLGVRDDARRAFAQAVEAHLQANRTPDTSPASAVAPPEIFMRDFQSIQPQPQKWIMEDRIPEGSLTMLTGAGGVGKSFMTCLLASSISCGWPLPNSDGTLQTAAPGAGGAVIICNAEDSPEHVIRPRLDALGADCRRIIALEGFRRDGQIGIQPITLDDVFAIEEAIKQHQPRLVILDPIQAFMSAKVDLHRSNEVRPLLRKLADLARCYNCGVLAVAHPPKGAQSRAMYAISGSHDFSGTARSVLVMDFNPINPAQSVVAQAKNNMGQLAPTLLLDRRGGRVSWAGTFPLSADQLMAGERGPKATERIRCMVWLHNLLKKRGGGMKTEELRQLAHEQDHSKTTLYDARAALGITTKRIGLDLYWILPAQDHASLDNAISFENFRDENHSNSEHVGDDENLCPTQEPLTLSNFGNVKNSGNPGNFRNAVISSFPPLAPDELPLYSHSTLSSRSSDDSKDSGVPEFSLGHT